MGEQKTLIDAAAEAGVKWILPTEYAGDGLNEAMVEGVPLFHPKRDARRQVEALAEREEGKDVKWIGVATGPCMHLSICLIYANTLLKLLLQKLGLTYRFVRKI